MDGNADNRSCICNMQVMLANLSHFICVADISLNFQIKEFYKNKFIKGLLWWTTIIIPLCSVNKENGQEHHVEIGQELEEFSKQIN